MTSKRKINAIHPTLYFVKLHVLNLKIIQHNIRPDINRMEMEFKQSYTFQKSSNFKEKKFNIKATTLRHYVEPEF